MRARAGWRGVLPRLAADQALRSWLVEPGSLTARCQRNAAAFRVRLLASGRAPALADELAPVDRKKCRKSMARVREVALECDGVPVIFAHTVLADVPRGRLSRWLARLGGRSLGSLLFAHPGFVRGGLEFCRLDARHPLYRRAARLGPVERELWARRSQHALGDQQVLVTEVFLPAIRRLKL